MTNALTIDVEDWYHVCGVDGGPLSVPPVQRRVIRNVESILTLLEAFNVRATFFVLGSVAEEEPALVPRIAAAGHEIASHGYSHTLVPQLGPERFRDEVRRTGELLESQCGVRPVGFRAPQWSIAAAAMSWAPDILRAEGYLYDSSCNPLPFVGNAAGPRHPFIMQTHAGPLLEIPPMVTRALRWNLPTGGGWGFRFFPWAMVAGTVERLNAAGFPAVLYIHPREMESRGPRLDLPPVKAFAAYGPRTDAVKRIKFLLQRFRFGTLRELAENWEPV